MAVTTEDLTELSNIISTNVKNYLSHAPTQPTLRPAPLAPVTDKVAVKAREQLLLACGRMISLVGGPIETVMAMAMAFHETTALKLASDMRLAHHVPLDGSPIALAELAAKTGAPEETIVRVMRPLAFKGVFVETAPGYFAHTGASVATGAPGIEEMIGHCTNEVFPSAIHLPDLLRENNFEPPEDSRKSAFTRAFNTNKNFFEYAYTDDKPMGTRFGRAMRAITGSRGSCNLLTVYEPLHSAPKGTTLVDIGGGVGHNALAAAQKFPNLKCVVQDIGTVVGEGRDGLPEELKDRVEFQENDFFKGQPIGGPRVYYYLCHILHDHPDPACREILSHLANTMEPGSRILIDEHIMNERVGPEGDKFAIIKDYLMFIMFNSKERTEGQWAALLKSADERFVVEKVWRDKRDSTGIIEARLA